MSEVQEQIQKCLENEYAFSNCKKKIKLNSIWIITSQNITNNAKDTIVKRYLNSKITFLDFVSLAKMILKYIPNHWLHENTEITNYLTDINKKILELDKNIEIKIPEDKNIYVKPIIYEEIKNRKRNREEINIYSKIKEESFITIDGKFGAGKSKLLRKICIHYSTPSIFEKEKIVPIYISFKDFGKDYNFVIIDLLEKSIKVSIKSLKDVQYLILIDSIDELNTDEKILNEKMEYIKKQISELKNVKVITAIRNIESFEKNNIHSLSKVYTIAPFSMTQIINVIKQVCSFLEEDKRLLHDLRTSPLLKNMPHNPMVAILLANILYTEERKELPSNLTELYSKYMEIVLGRWTQSINIDNLSIYTIIKNILVNISKFMMENNLQEIPIETVNTIISDYCSKRNIDKTREKQLLDILKYNCEIIFVNKRTKLFTFKHKSFMEYLYADVLKNIDIKYLPNKAFNPYWMTSVFFYLGSNPDREKEIIELTNYKIEKNSFERFVKVFKMGDFLLASYLTPYETIEKAIDNIIIEIAEFYLDIVGQKIINPLSAFSPMTLLAFLRYYCRQTYAYPYLKSALDKSFFSIFDNENIDTDIKIVALFFNSIILAELGENTFKDLLDNHIQELRPDIKIAILLECKGNTLLKDEEKIITRRFRKTSQKGMNSLLKSIISIEDLKKLKVI